MFFTSRRCALLVLAVSSVCQAAGSGDEDAAEIMAKVAANVEQATDPRRQYVYRQQVTSALVRSNGKISRKEKREYQVFPVRDEQKRN